MNVLRAVLVFGAMCVAVRAAADEREWRIRGEFKSLAPGKPEVVIFALGDESRIEIPLAFLADEDQAAIRQKVASAESPPDGGATAPGGVPQSNAEDVGATAAQRVTHAIELLKLGNGPLAKQELQQASRLDTRSGRADFVMGLAYAFGGRDFSKAIGHFRETVSREPKNGLGWANLAICAVLDKRYGEVASQFRSAFEHLPESQSLANNVALVIREAGAGRVKMSAKQLADLNDVYRQALADGNLAPLDPQNAKVLVLYGIDGDAVEVTAPNGLIAALAPTKAVGAGQ